MQAERKECDADPPHTPEHPELIRRVIAEINQGFSSDRWAINARNAGLLPDVFAAAGLRHCEVLAAEIVEAAERGAEETCRILVRSLVESWLAAVYLHHGGWGALTALNDSFQAGIRKMQTASDDHDAKLVARRKKVTKRNRRIEGHNANIRLRNEKNPDHPIPLLDLIPISTAESINLDLSPAIALFDQSENQTLSAYDMVQRIHDLTAKAGSEESYESIYVYVYRTLSNVGVHPTSQVLAGYIDDGAGRATFLRIRERSSLPSLIEMMLVTVLLLLAQLERLIFGRRRVDHSIANLVLERFGVARIVQS